MTQKSERKSLSLLLMLVVVIAMALSMTTAVLAANVTYLYYANEADAIAGNLTTGTKFCNNRTCPTVSTTSSSVYWYDSYWYVIEGDVTINATITLNGAVHLLLTDGAKLTVNGGIIHNTSSTTIKSSLTIYAQSTGDNMGKLIVNNTSTATNVSANGIYSAKGTGDSTIHGGYVEVTGRNGIWVFSHNLTINGGIIKATGRVIDGISASNGNITINGGTITTTSGTNGINASNGNITINGGTITTTGATNGINASNGNITINGGTITASGSNLGVNGNITLGDRVSVSAGSDASSGADVTGTFVSDHNYKYVHIETQDQPVVIPVTGVSLDKTELSLPVNAAETLTATIEPDTAMNKNITWTSSNPDVAAVDENGNVTARSKGEATITVITEDGNHTAACTVTVTVPVESVTLTPSSSSPNVGDVVTLTAAVYPEDVTDKKVIWSVSDSSKVRLYSDPECSSGSEVTTDPTSTLEVYAKLLTEGDMTVTVTSNSNSDKHASLPFNITYGPVSYLDWDETQKQFVSKQIERSEYEVVTDSTSALEGGNWYVVNSSITFSNRLPVNGTAHLILMDGITLTANKGISVNEGNNLSIYAQSTDETTMGKLIATGENAYNSAGTNEGNAGIGGNHEKNGGTITINGGSITATGGCGWVGSHNGAGIGGGYNGSGGIITINGGNITASGNTDYFTNPAGAGIGGGGEGSGGIITINGGTINASGGYSGSGSGIGGGRNGSGGTIIINDGTITATGRIWCAGIGGVMDNKSSITINGGTVTANGGDGAAGIGGKYEGSGGTISITGGTVITKGGDFYDGSIGGAGIGGNNRSNGGTITISGGNVTANGGTRSAGIGGGSESDYGGEVFITGGTIIAHGGYDGGAGIGGGKLSPGANVEITGGHVKAYNGAGSNSTFDDAVGIGRGVSSMPSNPLPNNTLTVGEGLYVYGGDNEESAVHIEKVSGDYTRTKYMEVNSTKPDPHKFIYTAEGATITAKCDGTTDGHAGHEYTATLTIGKPALETYGQTDDEGQPLSAEAVITDERNIRGDAPVKYYNATKNGETYEKGDVLDSAPTDPGDYIAEITLGSEGNKATASVGYTIAPATISSIALTDIEQPAAEQALDTTVSTTTENVTLGTVSWSPATTDGKAAYATEYTAAVTATAAENYTFADSITATVNGNEATVTKNTDGTLRISYIFEKTALNPVEITAANKEVTYSSEGFTIPVNGMFVIPSEAGTVSYAVSNNTGAGTYDAAAGKLMVTKSGTFTVTVTTAATETHAAGTATATLTVNKAIVDAPAISSKTYNAQNQTADVPDTDLYTVTENAGGTNVGSYDVVLTLKYPDNYKWTDSEETAKTLSFEITKASAPDVVVLTPEAVTYDPAKTLANVALPVGWAWVDETTVPIVNNSGYAAALTVDDNNYDYTGVDGYDAETHKVTRTVLLTVKKAANPLEYAETQTVTKTFSESAQTADLEAASSGEGTVTYAIASQKDSSNTDVSHFSLNGTTLTFAGSTPAGTYAVVVQATAAGSDNYESGTKDSTVTVTIDKADQDAPEAPTMAGNSISSITLNTIPNGEYSRDGQNWQDSPTFAGLEMNQSYSFYQRYKEDNNHNASPSSSEPSTFSTADHEHQWSYTAQGDTITAVCANSDGGHSGSTTAPLKIIAPTLTVYGGNGSAEASIQGGIDGVTTPDIVYKKGEETLSTAPTDAGSYTASITLESATASVDYTIQTAAMSVTAAGWSGTYDGNAHAITVTVTAPEGTQIAYREADSGEYSLTENPSYTDVGEYKVYYQVTKENYTTVEGSMVVTISNATLMNASVTQKDPLTYNSAAQTPVVNTYAVAVNNQPVTFTYSKTAEGPFGDMPTVTNVSESGTFYFKASAPNHADATGSFVVTVKAANPEPPTGLTAIYGQTLADVELPVGWAWADRTASVGNAGKNTHKANYTSASENYNSMNNVDVDVTVGKAANPAEVADKASVMRGGNTVDLKDNVKLNGAAGAVSYEISGNTNGCSIDGDGVLTSGTDTGRVTVNVSVAEDANYFALETKTITVTITDKNVQTITAEDVTATYGDTDKSITAATYGDGAISYAVKAGSESFIEVAADGKLTIKAVPADGKAWVTVTAAETQTYDQAAKDVTVTISKANSTSAEVTANDHLTYDKTAQTLVSVDTAKLVGGEMQYALGTETEPTGSYTAAIPTGTNAGTYHVWYKVVGDTNHSDSTPTHVEVEIDKADPIANTPTGLKATYGQTLAEVTLTNPAGNTDGTWTWAEDAATSVGIAGANNPFHANFIPSDPLNYNSKENVQVYVWVDKADPTANTPTGVRATYGQKLSEVPLPNPDDNTPGTWTWAEPENTPVGNAGQNTFKANFTPTDTVNYNGRKDIEVTVTVEKADPVATTPSASATYGQTLADVTLTNPEGNTPGTWTWAIDRTTPVGSVGGHTFPANFTPEDSNNYNAVTNVDIPVTVNKAENPARVANAATVMKGGNIFDLENNVTLNGASGQITYAIGGETNGCELNGSVLKSGENAGSVTVNVTIAEDENYLALSALVTVTITEKETQTISAENLDATYGDTDKRISATTDGDGTISYVVEDRSKEYIDIDSNGRLTIKAVPADGKAYVIVTAAETLTHAQQTKEVTVTISKANAAAAQVTPNDRTYDTTEQPLVTVTGEAVGGTMQYALGTAEGPTGAYTESIPTATNAGTYTVWYQVFGDDNHNDTAQACVTVTVSKAPNPTVVTTTAGVMRGGNTVDLVNNVALNNAAGAVSYQISSDAIGCSLDGSMLKSGETTGTVTVNIAVAEDENYNALAPVPVTVAITEKTPQNIKTSDVTAVYGDTDKRVSASTDGSGTISYAVKEGSEDFIDVDPSTGALTIKKAGTATVLVTAGETSTFAEAVREVTVTIAKASVPTPGADEAKNQLDIDYPAETVTPSEGYEVSSDNGETATLPDLSEILNDPEPSVYVRKAGDENHEPSDWVEVPLAKRPDAPDGLGSTNATTGNSEDGTITGVDNTIEYSDNGENWKPVSSDPITGLNPGTYQVRVKATESAPHGWPSEVEVGSNYKAMDDTTPVTISKNGEEIGTSTPLVGDELTAGCDASDVTYEWFVGDSDTPAATGRSYTVKPEDEGQPIKVKATQTKKADGSPYESGDAPTQESAPTSPVEKKTPAPLSEDEAKSKVKIDYVTELATPEDGYDVSANGTDKAASPMGLENTLEGDSPKIFVRTAETPDTSAGEWVEVPLAARPDAPSGLVPSNAANDTSADGTITGVDDTMEYSADGENWTPVSSDPISGLNPGTYQVRVKATEKAPHGKSVEVTVGNQLAEDKEKAKAELEDYRNSFDDKEYDDDGIAALDAALEDGLAAIDQAADEEELKAALEEAKAAMDDVPTRDEALGYSIDVNITGNGTVDIVVSKTEYAQLGSTIKLIVTPDAGYKLERLTYTPEGMNTVDITELLQFVMPAANVTVDAEFTEEEQPEPGPQPGPHHGGFSLFRLDVLPKTGFSAVDPILLPEKPMALKYESVRLMMEIPSAFAVVEIVNVPLVDGEYPVTWLGAAAGLLEGSALPGEGQSVLTGHNHLNTTEAGPFAELKWVKEGDRIFIRDERGNTQTFVVTANVKVAENNISAVDRLIAGDPLSLTLITCEDERTEGGYANRRVIAAKPL